MNARFQSGYRTISVLGFRAVASYLRRYLTQQREKKKKNGFGFQNLQTIKGLKSIEMHTFLFSEAF